MPCRPDRQRSRQHSGLWWYRVHLEDVVLDGGRTEGWVAAGDRQGSEWIGTGDEHPLELLPEEWPSVTRGGVTLDAVASVDVVDPQWYVDVEITGLAPDAAETVTLTGAYRFSWECWDSVEPKMLDSAETAGTATDSVALSRPSDGVRKASLVVSGRKPDRACTNGWGAAAGDWTGTLATSFWDEPVVAQPYSWAYDAY